MATRSTAGTGVVVSLVVFVLCTVFLLVLTIVFYTGQTKAEQDFQKSNATLTRYVSKDLRNLQSIKAILDEVKISRGDSVVRFLQLKQEDIMQYVAGNRTASLNSVKDQFKRLGVSDESSVRDALQQQGRDLRSRQSEIDGLKTQLAARDSEIRGLEARTKQIQDDHQNELNAVIGRIAA